MLNTLFGSRVDAAIERIRGYEPLTQGKGFYVAFSGGKDSIVVKELVKRSGVKADCHFHVTTVDPPELLRFIKQHHPDVAWDYPALSMWKLIEKEKHPPTRRQKYCCRTLKEYGGSGRFVITGIRWAESGSRGNRQMTETCYKNEGKRFLHPIIDWSDQDVWEFIRSDSLPYPALYDEGHKRIGCIGCPLSRDDRFDDFRRWPHYEKMYRRAFGLAIARRKETGLKCEGAYATADAMFDWWMADNAKDKDTGPSLFE
jgi:phosphoadenosine phosphosulfate reductase